jgi:hypothetical protein
MRRVAGGGDKFLRGAGWWRRAGRGPFCFASGASPATPLEGHPPDRPVFDNADDPELPLNCHPRELRRRREKPEAITRADGSRRARAASSRAGFRASSAPRARTSTLHHWRIEVPPPHAPVATDSASPCGGGATSMRRVPEAAISFFEGLWWRCAGRRQFCVASGAGPAPRWSPLQTVRFCRGELGALQRKATSRRPSVMAPLERCATPDRSHARAA